MAKLKIKEMEGTLKDIDELFQKHNCDLSSYIGAEKSVPKSIKVWLWFCSVLHFVLASLLWLDIFILPVNKILLLGLIVSAIILIFCVYLQFKNLKLAILCFFGTLLIILVTLNVYTPQEAMEKIEETILNNYEK
jgi:apolipoprotein N-acyltransferase